MVTNTDEVVESSKNNLNDNIDDNEANPLRESKCVDEEVLPLCWMDRFQLTIKNPNKISKDLAHEVIASTQRAKFFKKVQKKNREITFHHQNNLQFDETNSLFASKAKIHVF